SEGKVGGGQLARLSIMEKLQQDGFAPVLLSSFENELTDEARQRNLEVKVEPILQQPDRFKRQNLFMPPTRPINTFLRCFKAGRKLADVLDNLNADLLQPNENLSRTIAILGKWYHSVPMVCHIDGEWWGSLAEWIMRNVYRYAFDHLIATSPTVAGIYSKNGSLPSNVSVVHRGIDPDPFLDHSDGTIRGELGLEDEFLTATIGRLEILKGQGDVLEAMDRIHKTSGIDNWHHLFVGEGDNERPLRKKVNEYNLEEVVHFLGYREDIPGILSDIDCLIHPSYSESGPLVILEAGFSGIPVIATDVGGTPEYLNHGKFGWMYEPGNISELATALKTIMSMDGQKRREIGRDLREHCMNNFTLENMYNNTKAIYEKLLHDGVTNDGK
ncbi:MAG: glycosyltransferase family 4 protein, partial [bacterium]